MKKSITSVMALSLAGMICLLCLKPLNAQDFTNAISFTPGTLQSFTDDQLTDFLNLLAETPAIDPTNLPRFAGGFYSLQHPEFPPFPADIYGTPAWNIGGGLYLLSDLDVDYGGGASMHKHANISDVLDLYQWGKERGSKPSFSTKRPVSQS